MDESPKGSGAERRVDERVGAQLTVRFSTDESLVGAVRSYSANLGLGGLCLAVSRSYQPGDTIHLVLETAHGALPMAAVVAWCRKGYIGVRFTPASAQHQETLRLVRRLLGEIRQARPASGPGAVPGNKPFGE